MRTQEESYVTMLMQDANFASSVRANDLKSTAHAAYTFFKASGNAMEVLMAHATGIMSA